MRRRKEGEWEGQRRREEGSGGFTISALMLCSLQFAGRAMKVQNTPTVNEVC